MKKVRLIALAILLASLSVICFMGAPQCGENLLLIVYRCGGDDRYYSTNMATILKSQGYNVKEVIDPPDGSIANLLLNPQTPYNQVWVWDIASGLCLDDPSDLDAYDMWYNIHPSLVIDTRSYGLCCGQQNTPDVNFVKNVAQTLQSHGGGLYIGTDHDGYNNDGNALLVRLKYNVTSGVYGNKIAAGDTTSSLLNTPYAINPTTLWVGSVAGAPFGVQPNSRSLQAIAWPSTSLSYVSTFLTPVP
jgi:hypothetical protein